MAMDRTTILQIIPHLDTGGAERSTIEMAAAITAAGGRALVASEGGRMEPELEAAGGELIRLPVATKNPLRIRANAGLLAELVTRHDVRLLHARSRAPAWSAWLAARRAGVPFITTYHGAYGERGPVKRFYNGVMVRGPLVIANSQYTADLIHARYGTPTEKIRVIPRGVDPVFEPERISQDRVDALRAAWGLAPGAPVVLLAARLTRWKGQLVLIEAAQRLARAGRLGDAVVILAGDHQGRDDYRAELAAAIVAGGLDDRIRLVGHVSDMPAAFAASHVTVVASTEAEAFGRSAAEAQAVGCPVIATRLGAPQETVLAAPGHPMDAATGWLVEPGDAVGLADRLAEALAMDPLARQQIGARARAHIWRNFTSERMKSATLRVYDELLGTGLEGRFLTTAKAG